MKDSYMNSNIVTVNALLAITFLMSSMYISGMEKKPGLLDLPCDVVISIIGEGKSLEDTVKTTLALSSTCKHFNAMISLAMVGKSCQHYEIAEKNKLMKKWLDSISELTYWNKRRAAFILVYAGADNHANEYYTLLKRAIRCKDRDMAVALFKNNANPSQKREYDNPDFFYIATVSMAETFIAHGVNLQTEGYDKPNILWSAILHNPLLDLIKLYLSHGVSTKSIKKYDGCCILHELVNFACMAWQRNNSMEYVQIGEELINAAPEMINTLNTDGETPIDLAHKKRKHREPAFATNECMLYDALISLFENHDGKRAVELENNNRATLCL